MTKVENGYQDIQVYRSITLNVTDCDVNFDFDTNGLPVRNEAGKMHVFLRYHMNEIPKANSVANEFYQKNAFVGNVDNISDQNKWETPVEAWLDLESPFAVQGVIIANDSHENSYRNHLPRRMLTRSCKIGPFITINNQLIRACAGALDDDAHKSTVTLSVSSFGIPSKNLLLDLSFDLSDYDYTDCIPTSFLGWEFIDNPGNNG